MSDAASADALALEHCPSCGYRLEGLPPEGICPECGRPYDQSIVVLHGWGAGSRADLASGRPWVVIVLAVVGAWVLYRILRDPSRADLVDLLWTVVIAVMLARGLWKRWTNSALPGLAQVRLCAAGCCQVNDPTDADAAKVTPWRDVTRVKVKPRRGDRTLIYIACKTPWWRSTIIPVDADVAAGPAKAEALARRIEEWRGASVAGPEAAAPCPPAAGVG